jgi:hypothetical protein
MKCPKYQSSETYRKSLESMIIYCDNEEALEAGIKEALS